MAREFVAEVIGRAVHEEIFRQLLMHDAEAAANAMEMTYDQDDLRTLEALKLQIEDLDLSSAREYLQRIAQQPEGVFGGPLRPEE